MNRYSVARLHKLPPPPLALMTLFEQGAFELDDPIAKHAPEFASLTVYSGIDANGDPIFEAPKRAPTIRDLTRHTAGFSEGDSPDDPLALAYAAEDPLNSNNTLTEMAERLVRIPLGYHPGERWLYGDSVDIQAFLVERISGLSFGDYLKTHIFEPLGMDETRHLLRRRIRRSSSSVKSAGRIPDTEKPARAKLCAGLFDSRSTPTPITLSCMFIPQKFCNEAALRIDCPSRLVDGRTIRYSCHNWKYFVPLATIGYTYI